MQRGQGAIQKTLTSRKFCVTGQLATMTHAELATLVESSGGTFLPGPRRTSFVLVVGSSGAGPKECPTRSLRRARRLRTCGFPVQFLSEEEFLEQLGINVPAAALRGQFTIGDLAQLLEVSPARLRRWVRLGLLTPRESVHRLAFFDFHQVALVKRLCELQSQGTSLAAIRHGLDQIRKWLKDDNLPLSQLARLEHGGRLLFRLDDKLLDGSGQGYFDFSADEVANVAATTYFEQAADADALFAAALELEDAGRLQGAAEVYARALAAAPDDPAMHFNLGNVLFGLGEHEESLASYQAALRCDEEYAEAWNNLGNVHALLGNHEDAIAAFRRAIQLVPSYATAHGNLAETLRAQGQDTIAQDHDHQCRKFAGAFSRRPRATNPLRLIRSALDLDREH
jgi:tetratricopeptide (TPR) repeat protein